MEEKLNEEVWAKVSGFENYEISTLGNARSNRDGVIRNLNPGCNFAGYRQICLIRSDGHYRRRALHQLVAEAFCEKGSNHTMVRHMDGDPTNNAASNLKWGTYAENSADQERHGNRRFGTRNTMAFISDDDVKAIFLDTQHTCHELSRKYGICPGTASDIRNSQTRTDVTSKLEKPSRKRIYRGGGRATKLTPDMARAIFLSNESPKSIGERFGIEASEVSHIRARRRWRSATKDLPDQPAYQREERSSGERTCGLEIEQIREIFTSRDKIRVLAERYGLSESTVSMIRTRKISWIYTEDLRAVRQDFGTKLNPEMAREIYQAEGEHRDIGSRFGVSASQVGLIKNRCVWTDATRDLWPQPTEVAT